MYFFPKTFGQFKIYAYLCIRFQKQTTIMEKKALIKKVKDIAKKNNDGCIRMTYQGQTIGEYELPFTGEIDMKSPEDWVRGCICFGVEYRGLDVSKVKIEYNN